MPLLDALCRGLADELAGHEAGVHEHPGTAHAVLRQAHCARPVRRGAGQAHRPQPGRCAFLHGNPPGQPHLVCRRAHHHGRLPDELCRRSGAVPHRQRRFCAAPRGLPAAHGGPPRLPAGHRQGWPRGDGLMTSTPPPGALHRPYSVLFVCMGNICRSPTAHGVFRHRVATAGLAEWVHVDSAGTHNYHPGEPPDDRSQRHAAHRGYPMYSALI
eukprot:Opistho-1_new@54209